MVPKGFVSVKMPTGWAIPLGEKLGVAVCVRWTPGGSWIRVPENAKTDYIRKVFAICTRQAESQDWRELAPEMKDKILRFEVLAEDEWKARLNEMLLA